MSAGRHHGVEGGDDGGGDDEPSVLQDIRLDPSLKIFLEEDFDADQFATHIITQDSATITASSRSLGNSNGNATGRGGSKADAVSQMQSSSSVEQCVDALQRRLGDIDDSIKHIVGRNYDQLLERAAGATNLKATLRTVQQVGTRVPTYYSSRKHARRTRVC